MVIRELSICGDLGESWIRVVNKEVGAAFCALFDTLLTRACVPIKIVFGYDKDVFSHHEGANHVGVVLPMQRFC